MESLHHCAASRSVRAPHGVKRMSWDIPLVGKDSVYGCLGERGGNDSSRFVRGRMFLGNHLMDMDIVLPLGECGGNAASRSVGWRMIWYIPFLDMDSIQG